MLRELNIKICGEAGQGMQAVSTVLAKVFKKAGLHIFSNHDFMSRIRGGSNFSQLRLSQIPVYSPRNKSDIIIALNKVSIDRYRENLNNNGIMVIDKTKFNSLNSDQALFDAPFYEFARTIGGGELFTNIAASGVVAGIVRVNFSYVEDAIRKIFSDKSEDIIKRNIDTARAGYDFSKANFKNETFAMEYGQPQSSIFINGNEALALAAVRAGCKFYSAYPMSPSTSIMENISGYAKQFNIIVEQAEDEIAAINMVIGASVAGARAMCATSGGGFALMAEGLSLSGMFETPIVVVDAQRPAPATGFPTRTEQADLDFLIHAGHGEFARIVFSPGNVEQTFYLTVKAFNLAEKYQIPVLIMTDQYLADSAYDTQMFDLERAKVYRSIVSKEQSKSITQYKRYALTKSGISPMAVPSWIEDVIYTDSDEHTEDGHITEDANVRIAMVKKRFYKKMALLSKIVERPSGYKLKSAHTVLVGFGSTYGAMREACDTLKRYKIGCIHLSQVWPFPSDYLRSMLEGKKFYTVENNAGAQLAKLIRRETGLVCRGSILKFDGRPFDIDFLIEKIGEVKRHGRR